MEYCKRRNKRGATKKTMLIKNPVYEEVNSLDECISKAKNAGVKVVLRKQQVLEDTLLYWTLNKI